VNYTVLIRRDCELRGDVPADELWLLAEPLEDEGRRMIGLCRCPGCRKLFLLDERQWQGRASLACPTEGCVGHFMLEPSEGGDDLRVLVAF